MNLKSFNFSLAYICVINMSNFRPSDLIFYVLIMRATLIFNEIKGLSQ